jgi:23S rRNA (cytosine1962-C5)-methyltransferase
MDRHIIWPDVRPGWIVHDDADILVVAKPPGVSSQAADPNCPDDLVSRLRAHFGGAYLGVHQRLDRETSGLLVFARRREANARLAAQFEARRVRKTYLACVSAWPFGSRRVTLRDRIAPGPGGKMRIAARGTAAGAEAITHVGLISQRGGRALLELRLETGRTHQARVQLSHAGAPIAGDVLYGGPRAPRLLLHANVLELEHPRTGERARFESPAPPEFEQWMATGDLGERVYDDDASVARTLAWAVERRWALGRGLGDRSTTAFRLVHENGDAFPRLAVDVYDAWLVAQLYDEGELWAAPGRRDRLLDRLAGLGFDGVYLKVRPKQANVLVDTRRDDLAPSLPVRGDPAPFELCVLEEKMPLLIRLGDGLSTGVFLDQRNNRRRVRELAAGRRVANLFAYTCGFTVAAAIGGAAQTVSVDVSPTALERGRANLVRAGITDLGAHSLVAADAFAWLARTTKRGQVFDLVVIDPPSYSSTKRGRFVAESDYAKLAAAAMSIVAPGGLLLACTNHRGISRARFRQALFESARAARRGVAHMRDLAVAADFPVGPGEEPHQKSVLVSLT